MDGLQVGYLNRETENFSDAVEQAYGFIYMNVTQQIEDISAAGVKVYAPVS